MKKIIFLFFSFLFVTSCSNKENPVTKIAGNIQNIEADTVFLVNGNFKKAIALENGIFSDTVKIKRNSFYFLLSGDERTLVYLEPGDSLFIWADAEKFDESIRFGGDLEKENQYLAQDYLYEESLLEEPETLFSLDPEAYYSKISELKYNSTQELKNAKLSSSFQKLQEKNILYRHISLLLQYPEAHTYFANQPTQLPPNFQKEIDAIDLNNEEDFLTIPNYMDLVINQYGLNLEKANSIEAKEDVLKGITSSQIRDEVMKFWLYYAISASDKESMKYADLIYKWGKSENLKTETREKIKRIQAILPGNPSPSFEYADIAGNKVKLEDLKGKLVYLDIWATWCGPCIREIPHMKKLQMDYKGKNIEFVGISVDEEEDFQTWKKMVADKDLKGIQLFAEGSWQSQFIASYGIDAIPRFILLDREGKIISSDAPRPSDQEIRYLIDKNLD